MKNAEEVADSTAAEEIFPAEPLLSAPLPGRMLAAVIDYLVVLALFFAFANIVSNPDWSFLISLLGGALYFGVGNSELMRGQTLGKKAFGLRTLAMSPLSGINYITAGRSLLRYFVSFGILILGDQIPPLLFRSYGIEASSFVLELHMLGVLTYFLFDVFLAVAHPMHRSFHDILSGSLVVRGTPDVEHQVLSSKIRRILSAPRTTAVLIVTIAVSFLLWRVGSVHSPTVAMVAEQRYVLEHKLPIRLDSIKETADGLELVCFLMPGQSESPEALVERAGSLLAGRIRAKNPSGTTSKRVKLTFNLFSPDDPTGSQEQIDFSFDTNAS